VYIEAAKKFLDALEGHRITAVIQVHEGRSIETVDDLTEVLDAFDLVIISISEDSNNTDREVLV